MHQEQRTDRDIGQPSLRACCFLKLSVATVKTTGRRPNSSPYLTSLMLSSLAGPTPGLDFKSCSTQTRCLKHQTGDQHRRTRRSPDRLDDLVSEPQVGGHLRPPACMRSMLSALCCVLACQVSELTESRHGSVDEHVVTTAGHRRPPNAPYDARDSISRSRQQLSSGLTVQDLTQQRWGSMPGWQAADILWVLFVMHAMPSPGAFAAICLRRSPL